MATITSVIKYFPTAKEGFTTTTSGSTASGAATVGLNSVSGYTNGDVVCLVIEPTSPTAKQVFTGVVDTSGVQITGVVWTEGTNQTHASGSTVVDYATATHMSITTAGILKEHNQDGTHGKITLADTDYIRDANANELIKVSKTASAVNEVTVKNAATTGHPSFRATGGDTNVDLLLGGKGTGSARHSGIYDGWVDAFETWTYASATTFTCSASLAGKLQAGDKLKLTQTTAKYFYVTSVSGTTITINGGTDYTLANAAITLPYYSHEVTPTGFPGSFAYSPTIANLTTGNGTVTAVFTMTGKWVNFDYTFLLGGTSAVGSSPTITLPVTANSRYLVADRTIAHGQHCDAVNATYQASLDFLSGATFLIRYLQATDIYTAVTAAAPFAWGTGDWIRLWGTYEAA